jgi:flagellar FliL protein
MAGSTEIVSEKKSTIFFLVIATAAAVTISMALVMGIVYFLAKSGRLAAMLGKPLSTSTSIQVIPPPTNRLSLEPMVVNLADRDDRSYLQIGITLDSVVKKDEASKAENYKNLKGEGDVEAAIRDTALSVLVHQTAEDLLAPKGKDNLKAELKEAFAKRNPEQKVIDVYFTEFLVQR